MKAPTRKELSARGLAVRRLREKGWTVWCLECRTSIPQLRAVAEAPRFVTFRAAAFYARTLRGTREQYDRLEDVYNQLDAHSKGEFTLEEGYREQLDAELLQLLAALPDPFEPPQPPRYEVLTSIAETLVVAFSFPKADIREQVIARRAAAQAAGARGDVTSTYLVSDGVRRLIHAQEGPWSTSDDCRTNETDEARRCEPRQTADDALAAVSTEFS